MFVRCKYCLDCGDMSDVTASGATQTAETDCATLCSGDADHFCGGGLRLDLYKWTGDAVVFNKPDVIGRYEVSIFHSAAGLYAN
jgi:hypothetical protein